MTKAEQYYEKAYKERLRDFRKTRYTEINGVRVTDEEAAERWALIDLEHYKSSERKIVECCKGMTENLKKGNSLEEGFSINVLPNYRHPGGKCRVAMMGNLITFCPFCGTKIVVQEYQDEEAT